MPNEHNRRPELEPSTPSAETASTAAAIGFSARPGRTPLITALEIKNFKGIGNPVRIDLRPITLLFGRNSAGKSTILHALCYAGEVLGHRSVDVHKTELGGDQVDLGGFRNLVHGHDLDRAVRLCFELNLEDWHVPEHLLAGMRDAHEEFEKESGEQIEFHGPAQFVRSGWVALVVKWNRFRGRPVLANYEVGVNESLFGRIEASDYEGLELAFNDAHPLFGTLDEVPTGPVHAVGGHGREAGEGSQLVRVDVLRLKSPLPDWDEELILEGDALDYAGFGGPEYGRFAALVSGVLVGMGKTLQDELAVLRYVGPVRELRPHTEVELGLPDPGHWSDGSAAWDRLRRDDPDPLTQDLVREVTDWLSRPDRLDAGYKLQRHSTVELPGDAPLVEQIRLHKWFVREFGNEDGIFDLDQWVHDEAVELAADIGADPADVEAQIKSSAGEGKEQRGVTAPGRAESANELVQSRGDLYRLLPALSGSVADVDEIQRGGAPAAAKDLVHAIADAPIRSTLQLVTVGSELPVRTSDIGVGVSQILPVVVVALDPDRPGVTAIEQPELHVHPRMQVQLGDLFAQRLDQGGVFLIETHSEHLMLRLLRRIEETHSGELPEGKPPLEPDQVSVVFVDEVNGEVKATPLRIDETGEFKDRWPHGFFEERDAELF